MSKTRIQLRKGIKKSLSKLRVILLTVLVIGLILTPTLIISKRHLLQNNSEFKAHWFGQWDYTLESPQGNLKTSLGVDKKEAKMQVKRGNSVVSIASPLNNAQINQQDDYVIYKTANDLINIKYLPLAEGIKEEIILNGDPQITTFVSKISLSSVEPRVTADGQIVFVNPGGEYQFHIQPPFAQDAAGDITYDLKYRILEIENENPSAEELNQQPSTYEQTYFNLYTDSDGRNHVNQQLFGGINPAQEGLTLAKDYYLVLEVDPQWIQNPNRQYPITIDPTIVHDESSEFAGQFNRVTDTGSGSYPTLETNYQELPADEHTVGLWHMNEGSGSSVADSSGNGNAGTATGTTVVSGKLNNARSFNGSSDYVSMGDVLDMNGKNFTVEAWVKPTPNTAYGHPVRKGNAYYMVWRGTSGTDSYKYQFGVMNGGSGDAVTSVTEHNSGNWDHIAGTYDGTTLQLYVNGVLESSKTYTGGMENTADILNFGSMSGTANFFTGEVDEVRISDVVRTPEEIKAAASRRPYSVYTSDVIDLSNPASSWGSFSWDEWGVATGDGETVYDSTGLVAQWNFNETSGTTAGNATGSCGTSCDGTLSGFDDTTGQDADPDSSWTANNRRWGGGALQFDGVDSYVSVSDNNNLDLTSQVTVSAWVFLDQYQTDKYILLKGDHYDSSGCSYANYKLYIDSNGDAQFSIAETCPSGSGTSVWYTVSSPITTGEWHYIVGTMDNNTNTMKLYIDGVEKASDNSITYDMIGNDAPLVVGAAYKSQTSGYSYFLNGTIDSTRIYSRALTAHEVMSNYNSANIQFQTRVGADASPDDGDWDAWSPASSEIQIQSFDSDATNWSWDNTTSNAPVADVDDSTTYYEGSGSLKLTTGAPQVDANTVALWHLDETNGDNAGVDVFDATANNNDGEFNGSNVATAVVDGISGKAREFNGSDDYIAIADSSELRLGKTQTVEAWIKPTTNTTGWTRFVGKGDSTNRNYGLWREADGDLLFQIYGTSNCNSYQNGGTESAGNIPLNEWSYVVGTYDGTNIKTYLNGELVNSTSCSSTPATSADSLTIGYGNGDGTPVGDPFDGSIDEVKISNAAITAEEIAENYRLSRDHYFSRTISSTDLSGKDSLPFYVAADRPGSYLSATVGESAYANYQPDANTVGLWHLDEESGSGAYIKDASGNGNNGTPTGTTYTQGKIGKAREFDGSDDYINLNSAMSSNPSSFTEELWFKATGSNNCILSKLGQSAINTSYHYCVFPIDGTTLYASVWTGTYTTISLGTIQTNRWNHVAITYSSGIIKGYLNGNLANSTTGTYSGPGSLYYGIGATDGTTQGSGSGYFQGQIDEVRISNIARTASEIRQSYEVGRRTHPITIDFAASLDSSNLISNTSDTSFTINTTSYGLSDMGSGLYLGDKIIVRETVDGTEYIAQGTVTSVNSSTGAVTISGWDAGSTAPAGGYTANASVFKWQREYWPIADNTLSSFMDGITNLTFRVTDGNEGRTIWLDDLKSTGGYLTDNSGSTITSSNGNRYFQYRAIMTSLDEAVSATLSAVTLDYLLDTAPSAPTSLLTEGQTNPVAIIDTTPEFSAIYNDADPGDIANKYRIQVDDNADFSSVFWDSGASGTSMSNCTDGNRCSDISYSGSALTAGITYYWRIKFWDDDNVEGAWSTGTNTFSLNGTPNTPSLDSPLDESIDQSLSLVLKTTGTDDDSDYLRYKIELCEDLAMTTNCQTFDQTSSQTGWSGQNAQSNTAYTSGTQAIYTLLTPLNFNTTYYWRSYAIDPAGTNSWSATQSPVFSFSTGENDIPNTPILDYPANGAENVISTSPLKTTGTDNDADYLRYKIELCEDLAMTTNCQTFDQTSSQTGWSGQNAQSNTAYTSGTQATYNIQSMLTPNTTYYWRSYAIDPGGMNTWSSSQATPFTFTTSEAPHLASGCRIRESRDDSNLTVIWADTATDEDYYEVERSVNSGGWGDIATGLAANTTSYQDTDISNGNTYRYRVAPYYTGLVYGDWCYTDTLSISTGSLFFNNLRFD